MSGPTWERMSEVFNDALDIAPEARPEFLDRACKGDDALRREVEAMLVSHDDTARLQVEDQLLNDDVSPDAMAGKQVGAYRIVRLIGRGGMGDVYLAERSDDQYEHRVALKLIRPGLDRAEIIARFRQERQILAQLEHPNIATLLDGGMHDDERPYLVMQYVDGLPITEYCASRSLGIRERLELFRTVCNAVHVAHKNLVVHRDLKPANILVDENGVVKLLDFGIAKLLDPSTPSMTRTLVMTPEHAAPEQVDGQAVTTATDVYALGVLLYELLTGVRPLDVPTSSAGEIARVIREVEPVPPSLRGGHNARTLRGELDHIVLMALRKEPERRYQSALEFGDDVGRYLDGQPVRAQPDAFVYRTRKFLRRNRVAVGVAALVMLFGAGFVATTRVQSRRVAEERDRARIEQAKAERIVDVLSGLLTQADPARTPRGDTLRVKDLIEQIESEVDALDDQPMVQARMWEMLAAINSSRSNFDKTQRFLSEALDAYEKEPDRALETARVQHAIAVLTTQTRGASEAAPLLRASLARHRALVGNSHRDVGQALQDLASAVIEDHPDEAMALINEAMDIARKYGDAQPIGVAAIYNRLGAWYLQQSENATARDNFEKALVILTANVGAEHPFVLTVKHNIAECTNRLGDWPKAESMQRELIAAKTRVLGADTQPVGGSWSALGGALTNQGRYDEALDAFSQAVRIYTANLGENNVYVANEIRNVARAHFLNGSPDTAVVYFDRSLAIDQVTGENVTRGGTFKRVQRAAALFDTGERGRAIADAGAALGDVDRLASDDADPYRAMARVTLATMLLATGDNATAEPLLREAIDIHGERSADTDPEPSLGRSLLGAALVMHGGEKRAEGRRLLERHYPVIAAWGLVDPIQRQILSRAREMSGLASN